mgnify:FL=1
MRQGRRVDEALALVRTPHLLETKIKRMEHARDSLSAVAHPDKCLCGRAGRALHKTRDVQVLM